MRAAAGALTDALRSLYQGVLYSENFTRFKRNYIGQTGCQLMTKVPSKIKKVRKCLTIKLQNTV
jgi:hypothetical protein